MAGYPLAHAQNVYQVSTRSVPVKWSATHSLTRRMCTRSVHGQFQSNRRIPTRSRPECVPGQYTVSFNQIAGYPLAHAQNVYQVSTRSVSVKWPATHSLTPRLCTRSVHGQFQLNGRLPTRSRPECVPGQYTVSFSQIAGYPLAHAQNVYQVSTPSVSVKWPATHSLTPRLCTRSVHGQFQSNGRLPTRSRPECVPGQYTVSFSQMAGYPLAHAQNVRHRRCVGRPFDISRCVYYIDY